MTMYGLLLGTEAVIISLTASSIISCSCHTRRSRAFYSFATVQRQVSMCMQGVCGFVFFAGAGGGHAGWQLCPRCFPSPLRVH